MQNTTFPFDQDFFGAQCDSDWDMSDPIAFYKKNGLSLCLDPTPFFCTKWYAWQNPDWSNKHDNPYEHYLELGRFQARDPSPLVDMQKFIAATDGKTAPEDAYQRILNGFREPAVGVYETLDDVCTYQQKFTRQIRMTRHRTMLPRPPRRYLVVLQTGRSSIHQEWFTENDRNWDILVNYYDSKGFDPLFGDYAFCQLGTKFTGMHNLYQHYKSILMHYDYILFLDDDIRVTVEDLNHLFESAAEHKLDLAQMALSEKSHCVWPELFHVPGAPAVRPINAVEIMMPVLSRRALQAVGPLLGESVSGFGLDLLWGKIVTEFGGRIGILNDIVVSHEAPIDDKGGAYYSFMRANMINPKAELWRLIQAYDLAINISKAPDTD